MTDNDSGFRLERVATGIDGVDRIIHGGIFKGGIYVLSGVPGAGKTILANQMCFSFARRGKKALYVTLLAETHGRMLGQLRPFKFFDPAALGSRVRYVNGFSPMESGGLDALLTLLRSSIREHAAELLVLDGMLTAGAFAKSAIEYKKFINALQTWVAMLGCSLLILTSHEPGMQPEHTIVDGIFELRIERYRTLVERKLTVTKFRGSSFIEGPHNYVISDAGHTVYPRLEASNRPAPTPRATADRIPTGIEGLDKHLDGGWIRGSSTLLFGPSGSGKTLMGLQYLASGGKGSRSLHFGFFERPENLLRKGDQLGLRLSRMQQRGELEIVWRSPSEQQIDVLAAELLAAADRLKPERVFIDGLAGLKNAVSDPLRLPALLNVLVDELAARGASVVFTEESRELYIQEVEIPTPGVSAIFHNIVFLRNVEIDVQLRRVLAVMKVREGSHDRRLVEYEITGNGVKLGKPLNVSGPLIARGTVDASAGKTSRLRMRRKG